MLAEIGIEFECPRHHRRRDHTAAGMADDDKLVAIVGLRRFDEMLRARFHRTVEARWIAACVFQEIRPMAVDLHDLQMLGDGTQRVEEAAETRGDAERDAQEIRRASPHLSLIHI